MELAAAALAARLSPAGRQDYRDKPPVTYPNLRTSAFARIRRKKADRLERL
jgi:hypothetical protein